MFTANQLYPCSSVAHAMFIYCMQLHDTRNTAWCDHSIYYIGPMYTTKSGYRSSDCRPSLLHSLTIHPTKRAAAAMYTWKQTSHSLSLPLPAFFPVPLPLAHPLPRDTEHA